MPRGLGVHHASWAAESGDGARQVFGDRMSGKVASCEPGGPVRYKAGVHPARADEEPGGRSQSVHSSEEAG